MLRNYNFAEILKSLSHLLFVISSKQKNAAIKKFKSLVELNFKALVNGKFSACTKDELQELGLEMEGSSYEDD